MIQFKGTLSENSKLFLIRSSEKVSFVMAAVTGIILIGPAVTAWCIWPEIWFAVLPFVVAVFMFCVCLAIPKLNPQDRNVEAQLPIKVTIQGDRLERVGEGERSYSSRKLVDVKKVQDHGTFYYLTFYFPYKDGYFICQKDLLTEGTLTDFEKLFEDKIERVKSG